MKKLFIQLAGYLLCAGGSVGVLSIVDETFLKTPLTIVVVFLIGGFVGLVASRNLFLGKK